MKKLFALLLALVMVIALAACTNSGSGEDETEPETTEATEPTETAEATEPATTEDTTEPQDDETTGETYAFDAAAAAPVFGDWSYTLTVTGEQMGVTDFDGELSMAMNFSFGEDGTLTISVDEAAMEESLTAFAQDMEAYLVDTMYAQFAAQGMDEAAADAAMQEEYQMSVEEYAAAAMDAMDVSSLSSLASGMETSGTYAVVGDVIYTYEDNGASQDYTFTVEGDTLTFTGSNLEEDMAAAGITFPMVLTRVG